MTLQGLCVPLQARSLPSRTFPQVFLQQCLGVMTLWEHQQRLLANDILVTLLPVAPDGLRDAQVLGLLSAIWHQVSGNHQPALWERALLPWTDTLRAGSKQCLCPRLVVLVTVSGLVVQQPV